MYKIFESQKSFDEAVTALEQAVVDNGFSVLHVHNLTEKLNSKGLDFSPQVRVFEVCNPAQAYKVLSTDIKVNMALPCRISVWEENGAVKIGYVRPEPTLHMISEETSLVPVAQEVESVLDKIVEAAR
ncbi:MAG: DUF302 domain-containing protein [Gammaproteobacteria bacterium]|nr:MAG: DUF302 domain-containing protein [Gammaproteobacteria bacterium]